jgi:hypothetical protein
VRYLCPGLAVAAVGVAWLVSRLPPWLRLLTAAAVAAFALWPWVAERPELLALLVPALLCSWLITRRGRGARRDGKPRTAVAATAIVLACLVAAAAGAGTVRKYERQRYRDRPAAAELERLVGPAPARIAYAGWNQPYLFFGTRMRNAVFLVPAEPSLDTLFYNWRGAIESRESKRPRRDWVRNLDRLRVNWVVWEAAGLDARPERGWMLRDPARFTRVYADVRNEIWQVRR